MIEALAVVRQPYHDWPMVMLCWWQSTQAEAQLPLA
jgi:hypothetical protein